MKWKIFSRKKHKSGWRFLFRPAGDVADVMAIPGAVVEGRIAGKYLLSSGAPEATVILQGVSRRGVLVGADVQVDQRAAAEYDVDVAFQPRSGRASLRPAETISLEEMMLDSEDAFTSVQTAPEDLACILYTSGTTGRPKGVQLTVENIVAEQDATDDCLEMTHEDKVIGVLPFFHIFGLSNVLHLALVHGAGIVLVPQYSPGNLLKAIVERRPTLVIAIPTMFVHLHKTMQLKKVGLPKSIRLCVSGGAPLPAEVLDAFEKETGIRMLEGYGLTETVGACCLNPPEGTTKAGSVGVPLAGYELKILGDEGEEMPRGQVGEIAVRGKGVMSGYRNLAEENGEAFLNGWFLTGDMGYEDQDGYFFVTDRKKETIIKAGFNISPREVEEVLEQHPSVKRAAVIGRRKEEREEIVAFVTTCNSVSARDLQAHCRRTLARFKVPDQIFFLDVLPMGMTGKVLKKELSENYSGQGTHR
jgi:long-chain acyl-CoA synthetase